jgi:hypothetical protein
MQLSGWDLDSAMKWRRYNAGSLALMLTLSVVMLGCVRTANAIDQTTIDNLQAAVRTMNFLESLPKEGAIVVGVVYSSEIPGARALAGETAKSLGTMRGPNSRTLQTVVLSTSELERFQGRLDVIFLAQGVCKHPERILSAMGRLHPVSISDDPICLDTQCCVLSVRAGEHVEISLNTALAAAVGARFSLVFMMVVKRR